MTHINNKNNRGFTIIETMVAVSIFIVITTVGMGALLNAHLLYQKSQDMRGIIDNLNFVMEDMSRNLRTGYNYHCIPSDETELPSSVEVWSTPQSCPNGGWAIGFEYAYGDNADTDKDGDPIDYNDQWVYYISPSGQIFKSTAGPYTDASTFTQLTSDGISINPALSSFVVVGAEAPDGDLQQPFVTIRLVGTITYHEVVSPFSVQTTVSQRLLDI